MAIYIACQVLLAMRQARGKLQSSLIFSAVTIQIPTSRSEFAAVLLRIDGLAPINVCGFVPKGRQAAAQSLPRERRS